MKRNHGIPCAILLLALLVASTAVHAAPASSEVSGKVVDREGNGVAGVQLTFIPDGNPDLSYPGKTNKRGKYFIPGLFAGQGDRWKVQLELEGYLPVEMVIESRTANRTLIGEVMTKKIRAGAQLPSVTIRPLGEARIDFVVAPEDEVRREEAQAAVAEAKASGQAAAVAPQRDPWDEALRVAGEGELETSVPLFEKAIGDEPEDAERRETFAKVLYRMERFDDAENQTLEAIRLAPTMVEPRMVLYSVRTAKGDLDGAAAALADAREVAPTDLRILGQSASIAMARGDNQTAIDALTAMTEVAPNEPEPYLTLGALHAKAGNNELSEQAYQKAVDLNPDGAHQSYFNLGALIMNDAGRSNADTDRAIAAFRKAIELKPDYAQAYKQLAFALLARGDRGGARTALEGYVTHTADAADAGRMRNLIKTLEN